MFSPAVAYFLLLGLQILALWVPPFRGRAPIFVSAIIACAIVLHSERVGDDPQIAYAVGLSWVGYLSTIDRLLFTTPELSCWRIGEKEGEAMSYGFGLKKLKWSAAIYLNPRGVRWNYAVVKGIAPTDGILSRKVFVYNNTVTFLKLCLGYDILHTYLVSQYEVLDGRPPWNLATTAASAFVLYCGMQLNHLLISAVFVGSGLSQPEVRTFPFLYHLRTSLTDGAFQDWPPLFGDVWDAFTVRRVWGRFWHKLIRRVRTHSEFPRRGRMLADQGLSIDVERLPQIHRANAQDKERNCRRIPAHVHPLLHLRCVPRTPAPRHARRRPPPASRHGVLLLLPSRGRFYRGNSRRCVQTGIGGSTNAALASLGWVCVGRGVVLVYPAAVFE